MRMKLKPRQTKGEYVMGRMAQLIRFMNETYRGKRGRLAALTGILLLRSLCEVSFPLWSGFIIDSAIKKDGEAIMIYGSLFFMAVVGRITFSVISHNVSIHSQIDLSLRSKKRVMGLLVSGEKISASVGDLEEFVENDIDGISKGFEAVANIIANLAIFLIAGIYLLSQVISIDFVVIMLIPLCALSTIPLLRQMERFLQGYREESGRLTSFASDAVTEQRAIRGVHGRDDFIKRYSQRSKSLRNQALRVAAMRSLLDSIQNSIPSLALAASLIIGIALWRRGMVTIPQIITFYGLSSYLFEPVSGIIGGIQVIIPMVVGLRRESRILHSASENGSEGQEEHPLHRQTDNEERAEAQVGPGLRNLLKKSGFHSVSVQGTSERESLASSLKVLKDEVDPLIIDPRMSFVAGSVSQILCGRNHTEQEQLHALKAACLDELFGETGDVNLKITRNGNSLSEGQRQRLVIAKALINRPQSLVLLDPTQALDIATAREMVERIILFRANLATTIIVEEGWDLSDTWDTSQVVLKDGVFELKEILPKNPPLSDMEGMRENE